MQILKNIDNYAVTENSSAVEEKDIMSDIRYICKSCSLITESLQKGCDVMQMPNGDIEVIEVKTFHYLYTWDDKKGKLVRVQSGGRLKKNKSSNKYSKDDIEDANESYEEENIDQMA